MNATILNQLTKDLIFNSDEPNLLSKNYLRYIEYIRSTNASESEIITKESYINRTYTHLLLDILASSKNNVNYIKIIGPMWILISIIGLISNLTVVLVLCGNVSQMVYKVFCVGLAITDLFFLGFGATFTVLHYIFNNWMFGEFLCKFVNYIIYISLYSSSIMLLSLTASRFLAVVHPWKHKQMKTLDAEWACITAWIIGIIFSLPIPFVMSLKRSSEINQSMKPMTEILNYSAKSINNFSILSHSHSHKTSDFYCYDDFPSQSLRSMYQIFTTTVTYLIPCSLIAIMNSLIVHKLRKKERRFQIHDKENKQRKIRLKVTKLVFAVTTMYCVFWLPIQIFNVWFNSFRPYMQLDQSKFHLKLISQTLTYLSCSINPFVYSVMSGFFKDSFSARFPKIISQTQRSNSSIREASQMNYTTHTTGQCNKPLRSRSSLPTPPEANKSVLSDSAFNDFIMIKSNRSFSTLI